MITAEYLNMRTSLIALKWKALIFVLTGIGTALKVLFGSPEENISLTKHEIVALLNSFGRHSTSVAELKHFREANLWSLLNCKLNF